MSGHGGALHGLGPDFEAFVVAEFGIAQAGLEQVVEAGGQFGFTEALGDVEQFVFLGARSDGAAMGRMFGVKGLRLVGRREGEFGGVHAELGLLLWLGAAGAPLFRRLRKLGGGEDFEPGLVGREIIGGREVRRPEAGRSEEAGQDGAVEKFLIIIIGDVLLAVL